MFLDSTTRLAKVLMRLSKGGKPEGQVDATQSELSSMVGLSREMINKQLGIWTRENWIKVERGHISILRPDLLLSVAAEGQDR